jgi:hypothetical protein
MPSKNGDRLSNFRALQTSDTLQSGETLDRKVNAVDRLHTSLELLLILLLGARPSRQGFVSQNVGAALLRRKRLLESQEQES